MISSKTYIGDGVTKVYPIDFDIKGEDYVLIFLNDVAVNDRTTYDIINNSIVFLDNYIPALDVTIQVSVATTAQEIADLNAPPSGVVVVSDNIDNVNIVAGSIDNVNILAPSAGNVDILAPSKDNIDKVAISIDDVNNYADTYYGSLNTEPTIITHPTLSIGDFYFDTITNVMKVYNGTIWLTAYSGDFYTTSEVDELNRRVPMKVKATEDIVKGNVIMATGYNSGEDAINVTKTINQTDIAVGIANVNIANGGFGDVITRGLIEGVDMSGYNFGDILYSNGAGGFTTTKPSGAYQAVGFVLKNVINGALMVDFTEPVDSYTKALTDNLLDFKTDKMATLLPSTTDWNTVIEGGSYILLSADATNSPTDGSSYAYFVDVIRDPRTDIVSYLQEATLRESTGVPLVKYTREGVDGIFTPWVKVWNSGMEIVGKNIATAWVIFNGTNGNINDSFNIGSVVRNSAGSYTITFLNSMLNTYYTAVGIAQNISAGSGVETNGNQTVDDFGFTSRDGNNNLADADRVSVIVLGGK